MTAKRNMTSAEMEAQVLEKIDQYVSRDFPEAKRLHDIIMQAEPSLCPRLWYGMPGYAKTKDSAVLVYFSKWRYITFGMSESVDLVVPEGATDNLVPYGWQFDTLDEATEKRIAEIVRSAVAS